MAIAAGLEAVGGLGPVRGAPAAERVPAFGAAPALAGEVPDDAVGAAATPTGRGLLVAGARGEVVGLGDAVGLGGITGGLNASVLDLTRTPSGRGYWLVARDGGVFSFGDAPFLGSAAGRLPPGTATAPLLQAADVAAVNLETPAGAPGTPQPKEFVFLAPPALLTALRSAGVDVVSLANNHALDDGAASMLDTRRRARDAGLVPVGAGANAAEAYRPAILDVRGTRVAVIGLSRVVPPGVGGHGDPGRRGERLRRAGRVGRGGGGGRVGRPRRRVGATGASSWPPARRRTWSGSPTASTRRAPTSWPATTRTCSRASSRDPTG